MSWKTSYFNISRPLIQENMRRLWPITVVGSLAYFLAGIFPILMNYRNLKDMSYYIENSLYNHEMFFMATHLLLPILTAVLVFRYLQGISSVAVMHAMPFSRSTLFHSQYISGLIISLSPILLNGLIYLCISTPVIIKRMDENYVWQSINVFSRTAILNWMLESVIIVLFIYTIAVFAGIVTGNSLLHMLAAFGFNFLFPLLYVTLQFYFTTYLFGYTYDMQSNSIISLSPFTKVLFSDTWFSHTATIAYIIASLLIAVLSGFLYHKRRLEKATESIAFNFLEPVISFLITFFVMTGFGIYFEELGNGSILYRYTGYGIGAVLGFILGQMIVKKALHVFNRNATRDFAVYLLITVLFLGSVQSDVTGYTDRTPSLESITSVTINDPWSFSANEVGVYPDKLTQKDTLKLVLDLHKEIIAQKDTLKDSDASLTNAVFTYKLKNGRQLSRTYNLPYEFMGDSIGLKNLYECTEMRQDIPPAKLDINNVFSATLNHEFLDDTRSPIPQAELPDLINALNRDYKAQTFDDLYALHVPYSGIELCYFDQKSYDKAIESGKKILKRDCTNWFSLSIDSSYTNTLSWLTQHGYAVYCDYPIEQILYTTVYRYSNDDDQSDTDPWDPSKTVEDTLAYEDPRTVPKSTKSSYVTTDRKLIHLLLTTATNQRIDQKKPSQYECTATIVTSNGSIASYSVSLPESKLPESVIAYFK